MPRLPAWLGLFLLLQGLYALTASGRVSRVPDEYEVYLQTESLWERGSLAIPQCPPGAFFGRVGRDGQPYAPYGPGLAFAALPHHALGRAIAAAVGLDPARARGPWTELVAAVTSLASSTWAALAALGLFAAARSLGASPRRSLALGLLLGVGTFLWPYGTWFYGEPVAAAVLTWTGVALLRGRPGWAGLGALALCLLKPTHVVLLPGLLALAALGSAAAPRWTPARGWPLALGVGLAAALHVAWNVHRFGDPGQVGYDWGELIRGTPRPFALARLPRGLFGLLLSPGKSLLLFAPPLLLLLRPAALKALRARPGLCASWALLLLVPLCFYGSYFYWEGGYAFGPRHLLTPLPLLLLPLALAPLPRRPARAALLAGAALGLLGTSVSFLEDQALGERAREGVGRERYYALDPAPPPGWPRNVYRLDYTLLGYPGLLWRHLRAPQPEPPGEGLEFLRAHLLRVRAGLPDGAALPAWLPWALTLPALACLGLGLFALRGVRARPGLSILPPAGAQA